MKVRVFLNGEKYLGKPENADYTIACDGGYKYCQENGIKPDLVLGDFDSLGFVPNKSETYSCVKDFTDGEGAVEKISSFATEVVFYNFGGGREDHFYGNLSLLIKAENLNIKAKGVTNNCEIYFVKDTIKLNGVKNKTITIAPFGHSAHILSGRGLAYSVDDTIFLEDRTLGISNVATEDCVELTLKSGKIFVFVVKENV